MRLLQTLNTEFLNIATNNVHNHLSNKSIPPWDKCVFSQRRMNIPEVPPSLPWRSGQDMFFYVLERRIE